jgi:DNA mismatch repair protein MutL
MPRSEAGAGGRPGRNRSRVRLPDSGCPLLGHYANGRCQSVVLFPLEPGRGARLPRGPTILAAGVVEELLENSLDAGAGRIDVEVRQGGAALIRVADDGCGVPAEDLVLALASHATSKLRCAEDLARIGTLGFRGEALASMASVAQVTLQSRVPGEPCGAEVVCRGGQLSGPRAWNGAPGTRAEIRDLFFNTPARRRFLKGPGTEMGHVREAVTRLALARQRVHWTLRHGGRLAYEVPASMGLLDRIGLFFGAEVAGSLHMVQAERGPVILGGYVGDPSLDRGSPALQSTWSVCLLGSVDRTSTSSFTPATWTKASSAPILSRTSSMLTPALFAASENTRMRLPFTLLRRARR